MSELSCGDLATSSPSTARRRFTARKSSSSSSSPPDSSCMSPAECAAELSSLDMLVPPADARLAADSSAGAISTLTSARTSASSSPTGAPFGASAGLFCINSRPSSAADSAGVMGGGGSDDGGRCGPNAGVLFADDAALSPDLRLRARRDEDKCSSCLGFQPGCCAIHWSRFLRHGAALPETVRPVVGSHTVMRGSRGARKERSRKLTEVGGSDKLGRKSSELAASAETSAPLPDATTGATPMGVLGSMLAAWKRIVCSMARARIASPRRSTWSSLLLVLTTPAIEVHRAALTAGLSSSCCRTSSPSPRSSAPAPNSSPSRTRASSSRTYSSELHSPSAASPLNKPPPSAQPTYSGADESGWTKRASISVASLMATGVF
mmetsp:Transcript_14769/g.39575  ORF Transcript_14769/g.39575 Transcript_14769/m.39575 type:complete len:379 (-) Transcript_14769:546-1682(-)